MIKEKIRVVSKASQLDSSLKHMLDQECAGTYPPRSVFEESWPEPLKPYATLCDAMTERFSPFHPDESGALLGSFNERAAATFCPFLGDKPEVHLKSSSKTVSWAPGCPYSGTSTNKLQHHHVNTSFSKLKSVKSVGVGRLILDETADLIQGFRHWVDAQCEETLPGIGEVMAIVQEELSLEQNNGFLCCLSFILHMYRWGVLPVVEAAQVEKTLDFHPKLWTPFAYITSQYGLTESGTVFSMYLTNVIRDSKGNYKGLRFHFNTKKCHDVWMTEDNFMHSLVDIEAAAYPVFQAMVGFVQAMEDGDEATAVQELRNVSKSADQIYKAFYYWLQDERVRYKYWLRFVQGPGGWGVNGIDGLTGAHTLSIPALDAFLGLKGDSPTWHFTLKHRDHMTTYMRKFLDSLEAANAAGFLNEGNFGNQIYKEYEMCIRKLKIFRQGHKQKVLPYFNVKAPERCPMTAGGGLVTKDRYGHHIGKSAATHELIDLFRDRLKERLVETDSPVLPPSKRSSPFSVGTPEQALIVALVVFGMSLHSLISTV